MGDNAITVTFDLATYLEKLRDEWGTYSQPPKSIEEYVVEEAMQRVIDSTQHIVHAKIEKALEDVITAAVDTQVTKAIEDRFNRPFQRYKYGEPQGEPVTLVDLIGEAIEKETKLRPKRPGYSSERTTAENVIEQATKYHVEQDLAKHVKAAKDEIAQALRESGAEVLRTTIEQLAAVQAGGRAR